MKNTKTKIVVLALLAVMVLPLIGCSGGGMADLAIDATAVAKTLEAVKADVSDIEAANEVIHVETDTILEGSQPLSDELTDMVDTAHMSSHAILILMPYIETALNELDAYKSNPEANRGEILVAIGKLEALNELAQSAISSTKWVSLMEWPVTDTSPHDLVHTFVEDPAITGVAEYSEAADNLHTAMHGMEDATSSLELDLELLRDMIKTAGEVE